MRKYFKLNTVINVVDHVLSWRPKGISNENIKPPATSSYYGTKIRVQFTKSCLKESNFTFTHKSSKYLYCL